MVILEQYDYDQSSLIVSAGIIVSQLLQVALGATLIGNGHIENNEEKDLRHEGYNCISDQDPPECVEAISIPGRVCHFLGLVDLVDVEVTSDGHLVNRYGKE